MAHRFDQEEALEVMREMGTAHLFDLAEHFGFHKTTVKSNLDGLVYQEKLKVSPEDKHVYIYGDGTPEQDPIS